MTTSVATISQPEKTQANGAGSAPPSAQSVSLRTFGAPSFDQVFGPVTEEAEAEQPKGPDELQARDTGEDKPVDREASIDDEILPEERVAYGLLFTGRTVSSGTIGRELTDAATVRLDQLAAGELQQRTAPSPEQQARSEPRPEPSVQPRSTGNGETQDNPKNTAPQRAEQQAAPSVKATESRADQPKQAIPVIKGQAETQPTDAAAQSRVAAQTPVQPHQTRSAHTDPVARLTKSLDGIGAAQARPANASAGSNQNQQGSSFDMSGRSNAETLRAKAPKSTAQDASAFRTKVLEQVQRSLGSVLKSGGGSMKIKLTPEHLGEIKVHIETKDGAVSARFDAQTDTVRAILESGLGTLRHALEARGVRVENLTADLPDTPGDDAASPADPDGRPDQGNAGSDQHGAGSRRGHQHTESGAEGSGAEGGPGSPGHDAPMDTDEEPGAVWTPFGLDAIA